MLDSLPQELALDICLKLPIKSLVCCTRVCKSWSSFIKSPFFLSAHAKKPVQAHLLVRVCPMRIRRKCRVGGDYTLYHDNHSFDVYKKFKFEFPFCSSGDCFKIVGICNGVLCLSDNQYGMESSIILWNPTIKRAVRLPRPNVRSVSRQRPVVSMGFGLDPINNDYKVVRMVYQVEHEKPYQYGRGAPRVTPEVELYRVSSGVWQNISDLAPPIVAGVPRIYYDEEETSQAYLNGAVHWLGYYYDHQEQRGLSHSVVLFDMSLELFGEIKLSDSLADSVPWAEMSIWVHREKLSVALHERFGNFPSCSLWIMEDYGVAESWTQLFKIDLRLHPVWNSENGYRRPLGFRNTGEFLLERKDGRLISYDQESQLYKNLNIQSARQSRYRKSFYAHSYTESLAFLDRGAEFAYETENKQKRERQGDGNYRRSTRVKKSNKSADFIYF